jgi:hypothetical protein
LAGAFAAGFLAAALAAGLAAALAAGFLAGAFIGLVLRVGAPWNVTSATWLINTQSSRLGVGWYDYVQNQYQPQTDFSGDPYRILR